MNPEEALWVADLGRKLAELRDPHALGRGHADTLNRALDDMMIRAQEDYFRRQYNDRWRTHIIPADAPLIANIFAAYVRQFVTQD